MRTAALLRVASVITLLFAAGHTMGGLDSWSPPGDTEVLRSMRSFRFDAMGWTRTYWDFYVGFGLYITVLLLLQAVLLWQLASVAKAGSVRVRPLIASFLVVSAACAVVAWKFIVLPPVVFSLVIAACLAAAYRSA